MKLKISQKAQEDLINIWEYTYKNWSLIQADRYYQIIINCINEVRKQPDLGKNYGFIRNGYRANKVKSHIVFYRLTSEDEIEIIRILHQRMDLKNRLSE